MENVKLERYPFMYKDEEIGIFVIEKLAKGAYIYSLELTSSSNNSDKMPWDLEGLDGNFISKESNYVLHTDLLMNWVKERIFPKERQNAESLLKYMGLKEYDQVEILKYTNGSTSDDFYWIKFKPNYTYKKVLSDRRG